LTSICVALKHAHFPAKWIPVRRNTRWRLSLIS
jgi:hypothetical protein